jgi:hypothetical protein
MVLPQTTAPALRNCLTATALVIGKIGNPARAVQLCDFERILDRHRQARQRAFPLAPSRA